MFGGQNVLGEVKIFGVKIFGGQTFFRGGKNLWGSNILRGQIFLRLNIFEKVKFWDGQYLGGQYFILMNFFSEVKTFYAPVKQN